MPSIALVAMPFASSRRPSLQIGLLKGLAERSGWSASAFHFNLDFAALIGRDAYEALCQHRGIQLNDWLFSVEAFRDEAPDPSGEFLQSEPGELEAALRAAGPSCDRAWLTRVRNVLVPFYLKALVGSRDWSAFDAIGFTCTFQQSVASFAFARRLKETYPELRTIFGGANFDDVMGPELVKHFSFIDFGVIGEGDKTLPALLEAIATTDNPHLVKGVASRSASGNLEHVSLDAPFEDMDSLPTPDYDDYFARAERLGFFKDDPRRNVDLPFESARGCWWGQKHHCLFCGLNAGTMRFRSKSPDRVFDEISELSRRYKSFHLEAVDNILDQGYFNTVLEKIASTSASWNIFYETKSNLKPAQVRQLARAGVQRIQPGIESLSSDVLKIMRKGVRGIQNVNLLRWCAVQNIRVSWNFLWGFPGEEERSYSEQLELFPLIGHLQPPDGQGRLWMERFSPLFTQPNQFGVHTMRPLSSYRFVYPHSLDLSKVAYFFDYEMKGAIPESFFGPLVAQLDSWRNQWNGDARPFLRCLSSPGFTQIEDARSEERKGVYMLEGLLSDVYQACLESPIAVKRIAGALDQPEWKVEETVSAFIDQGLMMREGVQCLSLALPARVRA